MFRGLFRYEPLSLVRLEVGSPVCRVCGGCGWRCSLVGCLGGLRVALRGAVIVSAVPGGGWVPRGALLLTSVGVRWKGWPVLPEVGCLLLLYRDLSGLPGCGRRPRRVLSGALSSDCSHRGRWVAGMSGLVSWKRRDRPAAVRMKGEGSRFFPG